MRYFTHVIPTLATFLTAAGAAACDGRERRTSRTTT